MSVQTEKLYLEKAKAVLQTVMAKSEYGVYQDCDASIYSCFLKIAQYYNIVTAKESHQTKPLEKWQLVKEENEKRKLIHYTVENMSDIINIPVRKVKLKGSWYQQNGEPMIAFYKEDLRPVAIIPQGCDSYKMFCHRQNKEIIINSANATMLDENVYIAYKPFPEKPLSINDILRYFVSTIVKKDLLMFLCAGFISGVLSLAFPLAIGKVFANIVPYEEKGQLAVIVLMLLVLTTIGFFVKILQSCTLTKIETQMDKFLQMAIWYRLLHLPGKFFRQFAAGDLSQRVCAVNNIRTICASVLSDSFLAAVFSFFNFALLFFYSVKLALVALVFVLIYCVLLSFGTYYMLKFQRRQLKIQGEVNGLLVQFFSGIAKIRSFAAENRLFYVWAKKYRELLKYNFKAGLVNVYIAAFSSGIQLLTAAVIFYLFVQVQKESKLSEADFAAFNAAFIVFFSAMSTIASSLLSLCRIEPLYKRALPILQTATEKSSGSQVVMLEGNILADSVSFRYHEKLPLVLDNVSIKADQGEFIAVVGASGSGKSTLVRLLLGFEKTEKGCIFFDNNDITKLDIKNIRKQSGVVLQNGKLLSLNILYNIIGVSSLSEKDAWEALELTCLKKDVEKMPMGLYTMVGEQGCALSGGQRQRLLLARALAKKPKIIILDEATSALESTVQAEIMENIGKMQLTRIVIAHRLQTVINADRIYVLDQGKVVEAGTYNELLEKKGVFAAMLKRQVA